MFFSKECVFLRYTLVYCKDLTKKNQNELRIHRARAAFPRPCILSSMTYTMVIRPERPPGWPLIITPPREKRRHVAEVVPRPREWQRGLRWVSFSLFQVRHTGEPGTRTCRLLRSRAASRDVWPPPARVSTIREKLVGWLSPPCSCGAVRTCCIVSYR